MLRKLSTVLVVILLFNLFGCSSTKRTVETTERVTISVTEEKIPVPPVIIRDLPAEKLPDIDTSKYVEIYSGKDQRGNEIKFKKPKQGKPTFDATIKPPPLNDKDTSISKEKETTVTKTVQPGFWAKLWYGIQGIWHILSIMAVGIIILVIVLKMRM